VPWPTRLRIDKVGEVYSRTWSFSGPHGRALFTIGPDADEEPILTWLAIGYRDIYSSRAPGIHQPTRMDRSPARGPASRMMTMPTEGCIMAASAASRQYPPVGKPAHNGGYACGSPQRLDDAP
jgi:hypothetical protein